MFYSVQADGNSTGIDGEGDEGRLMSFVDVEVEVGVEVEVVCGWTGGRLSLEEAVGWPSARWAAATGRRWATTF